MADSTIRGFAWFIRPTDRRTPFGGGAGMRYAWPLSAGEPGVHNDFGPTAFLVVTETADPPATEAGWDAEPARLDPDFDAPGVRLILVSGERESPRGPLQECIFEVAGP